MSDRGTVYIGLKYGPIRIEDRTESDSGTEDLELAYGSPD
jgi:hypothetical protein